MRSELFIFRRLEASANEASKEKDDAKNKVGKYNNDNCINLVILYQQRRMGIIECHELDKREEFFLLLDGRIQDFNQVWVSRPQ